MAAVNKNRATAAGDLRLDFGVSLNGNLKYFKAMIYARCLSAILR